MIAILHRHAPAQRCQSQQTAFLVDSRVSPSMCCVKWFLARSQTGSVPQHAKGSATHAFLSIVSCTGVRISSGLIGRSRAAASRVRQMFTRQSRRDHTHLVQCPQFSFFEPSRTDNVEQWRHISFQLGRNLRVYSTRTSMKKSRSDSLRCSLVRMTLEANSMVHSQWLNLLGRFPSVQSPFLR